MFIAAGNPCNILREIADEDRIYYFKAIPYEPKNLIMM